MNFYTTLTALFILAFLAFRINKYFQVTKWRRQLKRGDLVRFYYAGQFHTGKIKHFRKLGTEANIRYHDGAGIVVFNLPVKILLPV
jgi:hypothetical protein